MSQRPPRYTRTYTLFPVTALFRSKRRLVGQDRLERAVPDLGVEQVQPRSLHLDHYVVGAGRRFRHVAGTQRLLLAVAVEDEGLHGSATPDQASARSEEHTSELQSLMRISYAVFCLKKKTK